MAVISSLKRWWQRTFGGRVEHDPEATDEFATLSSLTLDPGRLKLRVGVVSVRGNYREHNEDNYYVPERRSVRYDVLNDGSEHDAVVLDTSQLFIVADGMGGQQGGEQASLMAVELIPREVAKRLSPDQADSRQVQEAIREAVAQVNQEIMGSSGAMAEYSNMGTTVVLAQFRPDKVYVAGIGDSRAYRLRDGILERLTKDHSLADALLDAGTITQEELQNHKFKNVLYLYLGSKDARGGPEDFRVMDVRLGDRFLLATDGLTGVVSDDEIAGMLASVDDPQRACVLLKDLALAHDSKDNVTCLIVHVVAYENV